MNYLLCLAAFLALNTKTPEKIILEPLPMQYGDTLRTGVPFSKDPTVIRKGKIYLMYYSVAPYSPERKPSESGWLEDGWNSAIAKSTDLVHWERVSDLLLTDTKGNRIWGAVAPCVKRFGGKIHLFYQRKWPDAHGNNNIWHAVSKDGVHFVNTCDVPILVPDTSWSIDRSIDAEAYKVGGNLVLMFATRDTTSAIQLLGLAEAPFRSDYGPDKWTMITADGPLMKPEHPWEGKCIEAPTVIKRRGFYYMFYAGAYNHEHQQIGLAISRDGYNFERFAPDGLFFPAGEEGSWNHGESGHPGIFRDRCGRVYLFFQGKAFRDANYILSVCRVRFKKK